jgi:hypothetical protein
MAIPTFAISPDACWQWDPDAIVAGEMHDAERN